jgi:hypothetical protein
MERFLVKDTSGKKSLTATAFLIGFLVVCGKLIVSGIEVGDIKMSQFDGADFAAAVGALGAIYVLRRKIDDSKNKGE